MTDRTSDYSAFYLTELGREMLSREACYVARSLGMCRRIIHIGCGPAFLEEALPQFNILGADLSWEMILEARERASGPVVRADGQRLCFKDCVFDGVLFVTSLEFIEDYTLALKEASRVLQPGGRMLVLMLNPKSDYFKERRQRQGSYFSRARHTDVEALIGATASLFAVRTEYLLGIRGGTVFDTSDPSLASLCAIHGSKPA